MIKVQIQGRTLNKKGLAVLALATTITVSSIAGIGYKAMEKVADFTVAEASGATVEVYMAWGTENGNIFDAIRSVNPDISNIQLKQVVDMVHDLNNTGKYMGWEDGMPAGTYIIPVIE